MPRKEAFQGEVGDWGLHNACLLLNRASMKEVSPGTLAGFNCVGGIDLAVEMSVLRTLAGKGLVEQRSDGRKVAFEWLGVEVITPIGIVGPFETKICLSGIDRKPNESVSLWHGPTRFSSGAKPVFGGHNVVFADGSVVAIGALPLLPEEQFRKVSETGLLIACQSSPNVARAEILVLSKEAANSILPGVADMCPDKRLIAISAELGLTGTPRRVAESSFAEFWNAARSIIKPSVLLLND